MVEFHKTTVSACIGERLREIIRLPTKLVEIIIQIHLQTL